MANEYYDMSPKELQAQADALLAAADAEERASAAKEEEAPKPAKRSSRKKPAEAAEETPAVMTD